MGRAALFGERKHRDRSLLTDNQRAVLSFLWSFYLDNDCLPTRAVIARGLGFKSDNAAQDYILALERKGYLTPSSLPGRFKFTPKARELFCEPSPI